MKIPYTRLESLHTPDADLGNLSTSDMRYDSTGTLFKCHVHEDRCWCVFPRYNGVVKHVCMWFVGVNAHCVKGINISRARALLS